MTPRPKAATIDTYGPSPGCPCLEACKFDSGICKPLGHMPPVVAAGDDRQHVADRLAHTRSELVSLDARAVE
jgi:hypothetical protein